MNKGVKGLAEAVKNSSAVCADGVSRGQTAYACSEIMKENGG